MKAAQPIFFLLAIGVLAPLANAQTPATYVRDTCVKVKDGKQREYTKYINEVAVKLGKYRVDSGAVLGFAIHQAVAPQGTSAKCDYHFVYSYRGFPRESVTGAALEAEMKKAGVAMSSDAAADLGTASSYRVNTEIWRLRERVGDIAKGAYVRRYLDKIHPGMQNVWLESHKNGWKPLAEELAKAHGTAWRTATLVMPGGTELPYNALTSDYFPTWEKLGQDLGIRNVWNKLNPGSDLTAYMNALSTVRDRPRMEVFRVIEYFRK